MAASNPSVKCHTDISRCVSQCLPVMIYNDRRAVNPHLHPRVQFPHQCPFIFCHPPNVTIQNPLGFLCCHTALGLVACIVALALFFQPDKAKIPVIATDTKFFSYAHTIQLFPQGFPPSQRYTSVPHAIVLSSLSPHILYVLKSIQRLVYEKILKWVLREKLENHQNCKQYVNKTSFFPGKHL